MRIVFQYSFPCSFIVASLYSLTLDQINSDQQWGGSAGRAAGTSPEYRKLVTVVFLNTASRVCGSHNLTFHFTIIQVVSNYS